MRLTCKTAIGYCDTSIATRENKLYKLGQLEDLEEKLGLPLDVWVYLMKYKLSTLRSYACDTPYPDDIYIENTFDDEEQRERFMKVNGRPQRFILGIDFEKKVVNVQGLEEWTKHVPFSEYGKTWTLTKDALL
jgi:hypothetical protein